MSEAASSRLSCTFCDSTFRRSEHLSRHLLSHVGARPHSCPVCGKGFTRRDSLVRHQSIHETSGRPRKIRNSIRTSRACAACCQSRLRCDGQLPCARCRLKGIQCGYDGRSKNRIVPIPELVQEAEAIPTTAPTTTGPSCVAEEQQDEIVVAVDPEAPNDSHRAQPSDGFFPPDASSYKSSRLITIPSSATALTAGPSDPSSPGGALGLPGTCEPSSSPFVLEGSAPHPPFGPSANEMPNGDADMPSFYDQFVPDHEGLNYLSHVVDAPAFFQFISQAGWSDPGHFANNEHPPVDTPLLDVASLQGNRLRHDPDVQGNPDTNPAGDFSHARPTTSVKRAPRWPVDWNPTKQDGIVEFPDITAVPTDIVETESFGHVEAISEAAYREIESCLWRTGSQSGFYQNFKNPALVSIDIFDCFVQLYFEYFHPAFPLLHPPSFTSGTPWQLSLALAAVGCQYSKISTAKSYAHALQELLRRALAETVELDITKSRTVWFVQARVLNYVGMSFSGHHRLIELADSSRSNTITLCRRIGAFRPSEPPSFEASYNDSDRDQECCWKGWIQEESCRRLGFCSFLADALVSVYFGVQPCMAVGELLQSLPCHESLWNAVDQSQWSERYRKNKGTHLTVRSASTHLSCGKPLGPEVGDFARLVLGVTTYLNFRSVLDMISNPVMPRMMSTVDWEEDVRRSGLSLLEALRPRPSGSDGVSAPLRASLESHLFLMAILLCLPRIAVMVYTSSVNRPDADRSESEAQVRRWLEQGNGRTARLAVWYAGNLLGLVRERSFRGFHEPTSVFISTITLWTYGKAAVLHTLASRNSQNTEKSTTSSVSQPLRIDVRDETQGFAAWIDGQPHLYGYMKDVGNITTPSAPSRVVTVAKGAIKGSCCWGVCSLLTDALSRLSSRE